MNTKFTAVLIIPIFLACKHKLPEPAPENQPVTTTTTGTVIPPGPVNPVDSICYAEKIQPLLISNCAKSGCHNDSTQVEGINLSTYENVIRTVSGKLLLQVIQDPGPLGMPLAPAKKLTSQQVSLIASWVKEGMKNGIDCEGPCDTVNLSFNNVIYPLFQDNCLGCHNTQIPVLTGYDNIRAQVTNGKIPCVIQRLNGCVSMPPLPAPKLSNCKIKQIMKWIGAGTPNN